MNRKLVVIASFLMAVAVFAGAMAAQSLADDRPADRQGEFELHKNYEEGEMSTLELGQGIMGGLNEKPTPCYDF